MKTEVTKAGVRRFAIQWRPNFIRPERRLVLTRIYWNRRTPGINGYSACVSISLCWRWRSLYFGALIKPELWGFVVWFCVIPCFPIRIHLKRSYGGSYF